MGGLPKLDISTDLASAEIYLHGGHVTRFHPRHQKHPVLWMSQFSQFQPDKPIRGGIPICFPWFGPKTDDPKAPSHGYGRLAQWQLESAIQRPDGTAIVGFGWRYDDLQLTYIVTIGKSLEVALRVRNRGSNPARYEVALHSYFTVSDVRKIEVHGLRGTSYLDRLQPGQRFVQNDRQIRFTEETDRTYVNTEAAVTVSDPGLARRVVNRKTGSRSTVVWNPWIEKSKAMPDFGDDEWPTMVCIETANAGENAITLQPGEEHETRALIETEDL